MAVLNLHKQRIAIVLGFLLILIGLGVYLYLPPDPPNPVGVRLREVTDYTQAKFPLARDVPDTRHFLCKRRQYEYDLPTVSIVICFRNESAILLGRTVQTVFRRTPEELLDKIILVDDNGDLDDQDPYSLNNDDMKKMLAELQENPKVQVITNLRTEGLIRSRTIGADQVTNSGVIMFLDSHCEVNELWLEPMLERIKEDPTRVMVPTIDIIDDINFEYKPGANSFKGGFSLGLDYKWIPLAKWQQPNRTLDEILPRLSPAMPGGLFAIDRLFWEKIGKYDLGMDIWGAENVEMSVRIWQCGGSIEFIPCSRIGHMFRVNYKQFKENFPYLFPKGAGNTVSKNKARCVEVWFDEYKSKFYQSLFHQDTVPAYLDIGDVSDRIALRKSLQCKSMDWYLKNIYPELLESNPS